MHRLIIWLGVCVLLAALCAAQGSAEIFRRPMYPAAGGSDYTVTKGFIYVDDKPTATAIKICLYTAAGALLTNGCSNGDTIGTVPLWQQVNWATGPTLVSGTRYQLRAIANGFWEPADDGLTWRNYITATGTYAAPPATVVLVPGTIDDGDQNVGEYSIYIQNTSSQTITGKTSVGAVLTNQFNTNDAIGYTQGYVCCAF